MVFKQVWEWKYTPEYVASLDCKGLSDIEALRHGEDKWDELAKAIEGGVDIEGHYGMQVCAPCKKWRKSGVCADCPLWDRVTLYDNTFLGHVDSCFAPYHKFCGSKTAANALAVRDYIRSVRERLEAEAVAKAKRADADELPIPCRVRYKDKHFEGVGVLVKIKREYHDHPYYVMDTTRNGDTNSFSCWHSCTVGMIAGATTDIYPECFRWFERQHLTKLED